MQEGGPQFHLAKEDSGGDTARDEEKKLRELISSPLYKEAASEHVLSFVGSLTNKGLDFDDVENQLELTEKYYSDEVRRKVEGIEEIILFVRDKPELAQRAKHIIAVAVGIIKQSLLLDRKELEAFAKKQPTFRQFCKNLAAKSNELQEVVMTEVAAYLNEYNIQ